METIEIKLKENEEKVLPILWLGGSGEVKIDAALEGRGSKLSIFGAIVLKESDELTVNISINHKGEDTFSDTLVKSVLTDKAQGKFYGLVRIKNGAKNTNTYFREDALLLSKKAKAEAIPSLEIDENQVKAGHASTVGPVDTEQVFYLMSRGIDQESAKSLIVQGYFSSILKSFSAENQKKLGSFIEKNFNNIGR